MRTPAWVKLVSQAGSINQSVMELNIFPGEALGRYGSPHEIASAVAFLASEKMPVISLAHFERGMEVRMPKRKQ
jgi:NAD(P)-dependent dehydrogenase (short-subunit alcohol dehydrogenase family)